jgi:hypothetical protein
MLPLDHGRPYLAASSGVAPGVTATFLSLCLRACYDLCSLIHLHWCRAVSLLLRLVRSLALDSFSLHYGYFPLH